MTAEVSKRSKIACGNSLKLSCNIGVLILPGRMMKPHCISSMAHCGHCATAPQAVITRGAASCPCCLHLQGRVSGTVEGQTFSRRKLAELHQLPWDSIDLQQLKLWPLLCLKSETGFHWTQKNTLWDTLKPVLCASEELNDSQDFL